MKRMNSALTEGTREIVTATAIYTVTLELSDVSGGKSTKKVTITDGKGKKIILNPNRGQNTLESLRGSLIHSLRSDFKVMGKATGRLARAIAKKF